MKKNFLAIGLLAALAMPSMAGDFYVVGDVGQGKIEIDAAEGFNISKNDTSFSLGGGYQINPNFAIELAYRDIGSVSYEEEEYSQKSDVDAFQISAVASLPLSDVASVYGRLGFAKLTLDYTGNDFGEPFSGSESKNKAVFGIGASYKLDDQFAVRAEYSRYSKWENATFSALTIGAEYHF